MKIMFVTPAFVEKGKPSGGMVNYLYRVAKELQKWGNEIVIVAGGYQSSQKVTLDGLTIYKVATNLSVSENDIYIYFMEPLLREIEIQKTIHKICRTQKFDIIQYAGHSGNGIFHHIKTPAVMRMSSYFKFTYDSCLEYSKRQVALFSFLERNAARRMNNVYAPSRILANALGKDIGKKVLVMETPYYNDVKDMDSSVYSNLLEGKKYLLYYGRIEPSKGVLVIAEGAKRFLEKNRDCYLVFIGRDCKVNGESTLKKVRNKVGEERGIYIKELLQKQLFPIIQNAAAIIMPSYKENISNACMEAMDYQKIVIGTDGASYEQLITDGKNGFLFEMGNADSLLEAMQKVMELDNREKEKIGCNAKKRIKRLYPEYSIPQLLHYYKTIIKKQK